MPFPSRSAAIPGRAPGRALDHDNHYYEANAEAYAERTLRAEQAPLFERFAAILPPRAAILDLGCGAGRELKPLVAQGHDCLGIDLSPSLARIAARHSGAKTIAGDFRELDFPGEAFSGILAIASLLHLEGGEREAMLASIAHWLRPDGLFLVTMKLGTGFDHAADGRGYALIEKRSWLGTLRSHALEPIEAMQTAVAGTVSNSAHDWLAVLARKS
ncbi:class I SAM-dependent methyltransferase [Sphingopyxis panaciterrae]